MQAALDLTEVGVGELGSLGKLPQRQVGELALVPDESAESLHLEIPGLVHVSLPFVHPYVLITVCIPVDLL